MNTRWHQLRQCGHAYQYHIFCTQAQRCQLQCEPIQIYNIQCKHARTNLLHTRWHQVRLCGHTYQYHTVRKQAQG